MAFTKFNAIVVAVIVEDAGDVEVILDTAAVVVTEVMMEVIVDVAEVDQEVEHHARAELLDNVVPKNHKRLFPGIHCLRLILSFEVRHGCTVNVL